MELFEEIRREYEFGVGTIKGVARRLGVHRRMVREALASAAETAAYGASDLGWLRAEVAGFDLCERSVRQYVARRKQELGLISRETYMRQSYEWGVETQVDWV